MTRFYWKAICNEVRQEAISKINMLISKYGSVLSFQPSSDMSLGIVIETEASRAEGLFTDLSKTLKFYNSDTIAVNSKEVCIIMLNITFAGGKGDLSIDSPRVPG